MLATALAMPSTIWAQSGAVLLYQQDGTKLVGNGASGQASQGLAVAISASGTTAIVGGPSDNGGNGAAWIYTWNGSTWTQQGTKIVPSDAIGQADFGVSVSISANGNTVLIGGPTDNDGIGAAWVYTRSAGGIWSEQAKLIGTSSIETPDQGGAVAISADGSTAAVGGSNDDEQFGAVWVFAQSGGVWTQQAKLIGTGGQGSPGQGNSVALSANGSTLLSGGPFDLQSGSIQEGATWVFTRSGSVWTQQGSKLVGTGGAGFPNQGSGVSVSADGNTAFIGGAGDNDGDGACWVFTRSGATWTQFGSKLTGSGGTGGENQGFSVSISADGNTAVETGPFDNGAVGAAWVFTRGNAAFAQQGPKISGSGAVGTSTEGWSAAISGDASTVILGAQDDNDGIGAAWIFNRNVNFGGVAVTSSSTQTINIVILSNFTLGNINVVTGDSATPNFSLASSQPVGACVTDSSYTAGNTCTLAIQFSPNKVGQLLGAVLLYTSSNGLLAAIPLNGMGLGAQPAFVSGEIITAIPVQSELNFPIGVAFDNSDNLFIVDTNNNLIREFVQQGETLTNIAGNGTAGYTGNGGAGTSAELDSPQNVALDGAGNLYFADQLNNVVRSVNLYSGIIQTVAGNNTQGYSGDGGAAVLAELNLPGGVAVDAYGNLYIADTGNQVIRKVLVSTGVISTIAGTAGVAGYAGDSGLATSAEFHTPLALAVDASSDIYVVDNRNFAIRRIDGVTGFISTVAGNGTSGYLGDGGAATSAELSFPNGLTLDAANNIYIADSGNNAIRKVSASTGIITTVAGTPTSSGYSGDGGPATQSLLNVPSSVAMDPGGDFFFTDSGNNVVRGVSAFAAPVVFGTVAVSGQSNPQDVTITDDGNLPLTFTSIEVSTNFNLNGPDTTCTSSTTLNPGDSCVLGVIFAPVTGGAITGTVTFTVSAGSVPQVNLQGTGQALSTTTTVTSSVNPSAVGQSVTFTATISPVEPNLAKPLSPRGKSSRNAQMRNRVNLHAVDQPNDAPAATVNFMDGTTLLGSQTATDFVATLSISSLAAGSHNITAVFTGNAAYATSTSSVLVQVVSAGTPGATATTTVLTASPNPANTGDAVTLTATVTPAPTGSPLGTVNFYNGETLLGTGTLNSSGVATFVDSDLPVGELTLTAVYSGNAGFAASTSTGLSLTVNTAYKITAPPNPVTVAPGGSVAVNITVPPLGGAYNNVVTFSASGLPTGATATFNPTKVTPGANGAQTVMTIQLAATAAEAITPKSSAPNPIDLTPQSTRSFLPAFSLIFILGSCGMLGFCGIGWAGKGWAGKRSRCLRLAGRFLLLAMLGTLLGTTIGTTIGCGGASKPGTQTNSFVVTVTGTSGSLHASTTVTVEVQ